MRNAKYEDLSPPPQGVVLRYKINAIEANDPRIISIPDPLFVNGWMPATTKQNAARRDCRCWPWSDIERSPQHSLSRHRFGKCVGPIVLQTNPWIRGKYSDYEFQSSSERSIPSIREKLPKLSKILGKLCFVPPSSAAVERTFSRGRNILTNDRQNLEIESSGL